MYETILVPTDGSEVAEGAFVEALELAASTGATLHLLYVVDSGAVGWSAVGDEEFGVDVQQVLDYLEREGESVTESLAERAEEAGVDIVTAVEDGIPFRRILQYGEEHGADLIVMGTHGRRGLGRYILGSTTERIVRRADVPVLTVRYEEDED